MKIVIPFEVVTLGEENSYHLLVRGKLNGKPCDLLIDTGASQTVFDIALIPELPKKDQPDIQSSGINAGEMVTGFGIVTRFKLGELKLKDWRVVLMDMNHVNGIYQRFSSKKISGLIGSDFLLRYNAVINYKKRHLVLRTS
ncbi:MAG: retroviral-like aspartic protease family protein [Bacteroidales bacterium]|jgi:hypothetical protein|nr:retroviral-like aspartic protease family protein [Bacteroidales bacterium]